MANFKIKNGLHSAGYTQNKSTITAATGMTTSFLQTTGENSNWVQKTADISSYGGATVRSVYHYDMIANVFTADVQLDNIVIGGNTYNFTSNATGWQTTTTDTAIGSYDSATFTDVATGTTAGRVNRDSGGTPSNGTGATTDADGSGSGHYLYFETTSPANSAAYDFLLRGPSITLPNNPTWTWFENRTGTSMGNLDAYLHLEAAHAIVDLSKGTYFNFTPTAATSLSFINSPATGFGFSFAIEVTNSSSYALTWPSSIKWQGGSTPSATAAGKTDLYTFITVDGGTTYFGKKAVEGLS